MISRISRSAVALSFFCAAGFSVQQHDRLLKHGHGIDPANKHSLLWIT